MDEVNQQRQKLNKNAMLAVGSWSAANIIYGTIASGKTSGSTKYFHQMNAIWNGVTLGLVTTGHLLAKKEGYLTLEQSLKKQAAAEKLFLVNAGLDVAYIAGGLYMKERSKSSIENRVKIKGYGESVMVQGAALLFFDALMYGLHNKNGRALYGLAGKLSVGATPNGLGISVNIQ
jgi:hypothetical protein